MQPFVNIVAIMSDSGNPETKTPLKKQIKSDAFSFSKAQLAKWRWADSWKVILYAEKFDINFYVMLVKHYNVVS